MDLRFTSRAACMLACFFVLISFDGVASCAERSHVVTVTNIDLSTRLIGEWTSKVKRGDAG